VGAPRVNARIRGISRLVLHHIRASKVLVCRPEGPRRQTGSVRL